MTRGRPFEPGNHLGRGRPKGSRNKRSALAKDLLEQHSEALMRKALVMGLQGDGPILRTLLSYALSRPKDLPCKLGPLAMATPEQLAQTFDATIQKVTSGQITPSQGAVVLDWLEARRRLLETQELAMRVNALEKPPKASSG